MTPSISIESVEVSDSGRCLVAVEELDGRISLLIEAELDALEDSAELEGLVSEGVAAASEHAPQRGGGST